MSNPFDADDVADEKSGSLRRLLRQRKWIAAVCVPLILFHAGWLDLDALTSVIPGAGIPEHVVIDFLFASALFQAAMFVLAFYQFVVAYQISMRTRISIEDSAIAQARVEYRNVLAQIEASTGNWMNQAANMAEGPKLKARADELKIILDAVSEQERRLILPETWQDFGRLLPVTITWIIAVGWHVITLISSAFAAQA